MAQLEALGGGGGGAPEVEMNPPLLGRVKDKLRQP